MNPDLGGYCSLFPGNDRHISWADLVSIPWPKFCLPCPSRNSGRNQHGDFSWFVAFRDVTSFEKVRIRQKMCRWLYPGDSIFQRGRMALGNWSVLPRIHGDRVSSRWHPTVNIFMLGFFSQISIHSRCFILKQTQRNYNSTVVAPLQGSSNLAHTQ